MISYLQMRLRRNQTCNYSSWLDDTDNTIYNWPSDRWIVHYKWRYKWIFSGNNGSIAWFCATSQSRRIVARWKFEFVCWWWLWSGSSIYWEGYHAQFNTDRVEQVTNKVTIILPDLDPLLPPEESQHQNDLEDTKPAAEEEPCVDSGGNNDTIGNKNVQIKEFLYESVTTWSWQHDALLVDLLINYLTKQFNKSMKEKQMAHAMPRMWTLCDWSKLEVIS